MPIESSISNDKTKKDSNKKKNETVEKEFKKE